MSQKDVVLQELTRRAEVGLEVPDTGTPKGLGVFATTIPKHEYVCEYKTKVVYPISEKKRWLAEYDANQEGGYIVVARVEGQVMCFDATRKLHQFGRYINHLPRGYNLRLHSPLFVRGKMRIGFYSLRDIAPGKELNWDYGDRDPAFPWLRGVTTKVNSMTT